MFVYKTPSEIIADLRARVQAHLPEYAEGTFVVGLVYVVAGALSMCWDAVRTVYWSIWPQHADRVALRRWFQFFGIAWEESVDTESARSVIAIELNSRNVALLTWYESQILARWPDDVDSAVATSRDRGVATVTVVVSNGGLPVPTEIVDAITALFGQDEFNVGGVDLLIETIA